MDLAELQRKLIAAARMNLPSQRVPLAFEQRILARLKTCPALDAWALWSRAMWRSAALCVAIMLLLGTWSLLSPPHPPGVGDLSQEFENTLLAAADQEQPADLGW